MMELDKNRVKDILDNWRRYSLDNPPDPAEVYYYTISPDFRDYVKPNPGPLPYDVDEAEMVEEVFRAMFKHYPFSRDALVTYYGRSKEDAAEDIAQMLGYSRRTLFYRLALARDNFAIVWKDMFWG